MIYQNFKKFEHVKCKMTLGMRNIA